MNCFLLLCEETMTTPFRIHEHSLSSTINPSPEFAKKKLADFSVNVGLKCSHDCTYCSSGAVLRCHKAFKKFGENPFKQGYAIIDPDLPEKLEAKIKRIRGRGIVQLCTTVDAWCPAAQKYDLGRRCLEVLLAAPGWTVRILTKNTAVENEFDLIKKHRERVLVGLSLTGTCEKDAVLSVIEPNASLVSERMRVLQEAHKQKLRTFGMLCPLLPGVADSPEQIEQLVAFLDKCGVEEVFAEAVNHRGTGLKTTEESLRSSGFIEESNAVSRIRRAVHWSAYVADLIRNLQVALRKHDMIDKLRFLLYSKNLQPNDLIRIKSDAVGVVWL